MKIGSGLRWTAYTLVGWAGVAGLFTRYQTMAIVVCGVVFVAVGLFERVDARGRPSRFGIPLREDGTLDLPFGRSARSPNERD
jgi:hypothetical protein